MGGAVQLLLIGCALTAISLLPLLSFFLAHTENHESNMLGLGFKIKADWVIFPLEATVVIESIYF